MNLLPLKKLENILPTLVLSCIIAIVSIPATHLLSQKPPTAEACGIQNTQEIVNPEIESKLLAQVSGLEKEQLATLLKKVKTQKPETIFIESPCGAKQMEMRYNIEGGRLSIFLKLSPSTYDLVKDRIGKKAQFAEISSEGFLKLLSEISTESRSSLFIFYKDSDIRARAYNGRPFSTRVPRLFPGS